MVERGIPAGTTQELLVALLDHCQRNVPYYARKMVESGRVFASDPVGYLERFPILTRDDLRNHFEELKSADLPRRKWYESSSGGSTGAPARFILDREYEARSVALTLLYSKLVGWQVGERQIQLWGSTRDILKTRESWSGYMANKLANIRLLNTFRMTPEQVRQYLQVLNRERPKLILAYAHPLYELAKIAGRRHIPVQPQSAIITSAGTLFPFMRQTIESVFQCKVYNRYGCREVGDIACERPGMDGLWVAPWGCYLEIVDDQGNRLPEGEEGNILLTCLTNYAMPLVRYSIQDRGYLLPKKQIPQGVTSQVLGEVTGRALDSFRRRDGTIVTPNYFTKLLYYRDWIDRFQVVQKDFEHIIYKFVPTSHNSQPQELDEIRDKTRLVMGEDCQVDFEFVSEIPVAGSGKYRFYLCEIPAS